MPGPGPAPRRARGGAGPSRLVRACAVLLLALVAGALGSPAHAQSDLVDDLLGGGGGEEAGAPAQPAERTIGTDSDASSDADIRRRLQGIYAELEPSRAVTVDVAEGIVKLGGTAASSSAAERAVEIAEAVEGVVQVVDEMDVDTNVRRRLEQTLERLRQSTLDGLAALPVLLVALAVLALFWFLGRWVGRRRGAFSALAPNGFIAELLSGIARVVVTLLGVILALTLLDATSLIGTVLGAAGIVGLAVGFAVRDTVENYIASILLSLRTPFLAEDLVRIDEHHGTVARLTSRATVLISLDGNHIRLPNSLVFKAVIVNYSTNPTRRFAFAVGVDTEYDPLVAQSLALETLAEVPGVVAAPRPTARVQELGDSSVTLEIAGWVDQDRTDFLAVRSEAIRAVKQAFDGAGIVMPEPIYRLRLDARGAGGQLLRRLGATVVETDPEGAGRGEDATEAGAARELRAADGASPEAEAQARDVSLDTSVTDTVARERRRGADEDLLHAATPRE